jgi:hypothetical protein
MLFDVTAGRAGMTAPQNRKPMGELARAAGKLFPLQICQSGAGFYLGTCDDDGSPFTRESQEYWRKRGQAEKALSKGAWTQRLDV